MFDFNLAIIDVAAAWVVVTLPRMVQARLLVRSASLGPGQENRLRPDPVQQMSLLGTLAVPALTSLLNIPVLAWGKDFDEIPVEPNYRRAVSVVGATVLSYAVQAVAFSLLLMLLAKVYLAGAPAAARAGQLCLRLAMLNLLAIPILDAGTAWIFLRRMHWSIALGSSVVLIGVFHATGLLQWIDRWASLGFFYLTQLR